MCTVLTGNTKSFKCIPFNPSLHLSYLSKMVIEIRVLEYPIKAISGGPLLTFPVLKSGANNASLNSGILRGFIVEEAGVCQ